MQKGEWQYNLRGSIIEVMHTWHRARSTSQMDIAATLISCVICMECPGGSPFHGKSLHGRRQVNAGLAWEQRKALKRHCAANRHLPTKLAMLPGHR